MDTVRWGMIGCGDVAEVKSGPGLQKAEGSALVAAMRRDRASTPFAMTIVIAMQSIFSCSGVFLLNPRMHYESESYRLSIASVQDIVRCFCVLAGAYLGGVRWAA